MTKIDTHLLKRAVRANHGLAFTKPSTGVFSCNLEAEESENYANCVFMAFLIEDGATPEEISDEMSLSLSEYAKLISETKKKQSLDLRFQIKKKLVNNYLQLFGKESAIA